MKTIFVSDMACNKCVANITKALDNAGIEHKDVILDSKTVDVADGDAQKALEAIKNSGFTPSLK